MPINMWDPLIAFKFIIPNFTNRLATNFCQVLCERYPNETLSVLKFPLFIVSCLSHMLAISRMHWTLKLERLNDVPCPDCSLISCIWYYNKVYDTVQAPIWAWTLCNTKSSEFFFQTISLPKKSIFQGSKTIW